MDKAQAIEKQLKDKEVELASAHAKLVKLRSNKQDIIDDYMGSQKFKDLMEIHEDGLFHVQFTAGQDKTVDTILKEYPGMFDPNDFVSPEQPTTKNEPQDEITKSTMLEDRILDPENSPLRSPTREVDMIQAEQGDDEASREEYLSQPCAALYIYQKIYIIP